MKAPTRAMIMAAGLGTRMRPLTNDRPKPLVVVGGKALIDHAIDRLVAAGVTIIVVNVHYKAEMVRDHLAGRRDVEIHFSDESDGLLGTGGGVAKALANFGSEPFFIHNSDTIWVEGYGTALERMKSRWNPDQMDALLLMAPMVTAMGYEGTGDFMMDGEGHLSRVPPGRVSPFAYPGVQIVHPRLFDAAPAGGFSTNVLWDRAIEKERLFGVRLDGVWIHVGTPQAVTEADAFLADLAPAA
ncbi:MAG: nucleotidyltransferase family protein [Alphaproteobacteria bacterium]|nr:nucleotidyltransferase family protein [Alphaproteobacteria bacterium]MDE1985574.1 nucleotidyltransferase family protein [Alphaproteobacteria bacterium]MDE2162195.1 nucleotidyltransferase family protein [Alphaproteobacteria bacterium]MDE2265304.1 nucleotidyltransferase family protein [Alphaproteobacteria bacterium]MDE2498656.1 nucleotidyltransferase family protein [Alphaproteobacteria bacterium]